MLSSLKNKKFNDVKKWVTQNLDSDPTSIMRKLYDNLSTVMDGPSVAAAVLIIAEYQYKSAFAVDQEINLLACLTQLMLECNFKMKHVKLIRLITGEEIVERGRKLKFLTGRTMWYEYLQNALVVIPQQGQVGFAPWATVIFINVILIDHRDS